MKSLAPRGTGRLADSIYAFNATTSDYTPAKGTLRVRLKLRNNEAMAVVSSRIAFFVEFGTKAHKIVPQRRRALTVNGAIVASAAHPGARAHPFWRPALEQGEAEAVRAVVTAASTIVEKYD